MLASLIHGSPAARDHVSASTAYRTARAEVAKRKREMKEATKRKRAREIKALGPFDCYLDFAFKTQGCVTSYAIPSNFRKSDEHPRKYTCGTYKLMSLENINYMKAHGIEHVVVVQKGTYYMPPWWDETGMTFKQVSYMDPFTQTYCRRLLKNNPEECILVAKSV
jgi:hypothetical protein